MRAIPGSTQSRMAAIPIGGDPGDYDALRGVPLCDGGLGDVAKGQITLATSAPSCPARAP